MKKPRDVYSEMMKQGDDIGAFKTGVVDPMMQQYQQQVLPSVQQRFVDANAGSSSALNQALAASANDLTTQMGQMYLPFMQGQQQTRLAAAGGYAGLANPYLDLYKQQQANRLSALSGLGGLAGQQTFTPLISQHEGIMGSLIGAGGRMGAASLPYFLSSEKIKDNIRSYDKGLDVINGLEVKIYDFKEAFGGAKNRVGVIAERVPEEIQASIDGIKAVDVYGLVGLLINSIKTLNEKIEQLEKRI